MGAVRKLERIIAAMSERCEVRGQGVSNYMKRESHYLWEGEKKNPIGSEPSVSFFSETR